MRRGPEALLLGLLCLAPLTGCSSALPPGPPLTPASAPAVDRHGAPTVTDRKNVDAIATAPCDRMLTGGELEELEVSVPGRARSFLGVTECSWVAIDGQNLRIYADPSRDLLADTYRTQLRGVFQPTVIEGMPAVRQKTGAGDLNTCTVTTGLGPAQALETTWYGKGDPAPGNDACEFAERATALVVRKLPPQR